MDPKYYSLVEIIAFAVIVLGFCGYQIWTVRRKPGDERSKPDEHAESSHHDAPK